jgi:hypothetical protein
VIADITGLQFDLLCLAVLLNCFGLIVIGMVVWNLSNKEDDAGPYDWAKDGECANQSHPRIVP